MKNLILLLIAVSIIGGCKKKDDPAPSNPDPGLPKVQTNAIADYTYYSVKLSGQLLDSAGSVIKETGIVIDTLPAPTITKNLNKFVLKKLKDGSFGLTVTGLLLNKTVYVKAYAINQKGTEYGKEISFTTRNGKVFRGQVTLTNQKELNEFGANHYTTIDGDVEISGSVNDLKPLIGLTVINNGLRITNTGITNFAGLDSLELIGAVFPNDFWVEYNNKLVNFSGLSKLRFSRGSTQFDHNSSLTSLDGLDSYIAASAGALRIGECEKLQNLNGLKKLYFVGDDLTIINNPSLTDISGLASVSQVYGRLYILNNNVLTNLNGLEKIESLPTGVVVTDNATLRDISGLRNLSVIGSGDGYDIGAITIARNPFLTDLSAFSKITNVDYVSIEDNERLNDLKGLHNLQVIRQKLVVDGNKTLKDLSGLENVKALSSLAIANNLSLVNLNGLNGLTKITGNPYSISIGGNSALVSLSGLESLIQAEGSIQIARNPKLTDFCGLKNLFTKGYTDYFSALENAANPTQNEVITNCK